MVPRISYSTYNMLRGKKKHVVCFSFPSHPRGWSVNSIYRQNKDMT